MNGFALFAGGIFPGALLAMNLMVALMPKIPLTERRSRCEIVELCKNVE